MLTTGQMFGQVYGLLFRLLAEDDELMGDFEDLESGEKVTADDGEDQSGDEEEEMDVEPAEPEEEEDEKTKRQKMWEKKMKLKAAFNQEYDDKDRFFIFSISHSSLIIRVAGFFRQSWCVSLKVRLHLKNRLKG